MIEFTASAETDPPRIAIIDYVDQVRSRSDADDIDAFASLVDEAGLGSYGLTLEEWDDELEAWRLLQRIGPMIADQDLDGTPNVAMIHAAVRELMEHLHLVH